MKVKEECEQAGLKLKNQKTKIMASSSITSQQIEGEEMEAVTDLIFLGSKITANSDCSHKINRRRDITLPIKICVVKAIVFPVVM